MNNRESNREWKLITAELLSKYLNEKCNQAEREYVEQWYDSLESEKVLLEELGEQEIDELNKQTRLSIQAILQENKCNYKELDISGRFNVWRWAAIFIILVSTIGYLILKNGSHDDETLSQNRKPVMDSIDIASDGNKAMLTLSDGSTIFLDSAVSGALALQKNGRMLNLENGKLVYDINPGGESNSDGIQSYNTLTTPKGSQSQLLLPDGTKVWLNSASSVRFPTEFSGEERVVELTGEAYFEVAKSFGSDNKKIPFFVKAGDYSVEVLGTQFNINAYVDEEAINTTLIEGSVKLQKGLERVFIKPGQQASLHAQGNFKIYPADLNAVTAWRNGFFQFDNASIETVMRQIARWYNVEIVYENTTNKDRFKGKIYRNTDLSQVLRVLELSGASLRMHGKKIIVQ